MGLTHHANTDVITDPEVHAVVSNTWIPCVEILQFQSVILFDDFVASVVVDDFVIFVTLNFASAVSFFHFFHFFQPLSPVLRHLTASG